MQTPTQLAPLFNAICITAFSCLFQPAQAQSPSIQWQKSLGGTSGDFARFIRLTTDGGFVVAGSSTSNDLDVSGNHGDFDIWMVKLDSTGIAWQGCLGGSGSDYAYSIQQTSDGGFIGSGESSSTDGDVSGNHGGSDCWIFKLDETGILEWQKSVGGAMDEGAFSIQQINDGGYIVGAYTFSSDGDVMVNHGGYDCWILRLDSNGNIIWQKSLGGSGGDQANTIQQTKDGGFIIACASSSSDGDVLENHGQNDYWIIKLDENGNLIWQQSLGGTNDDIAWFIQQTMDQGFIVSGWSGSSDIDVTGNHGSLDCWIVKLDSSGNLEWEKALGGSDIDEYALSVQQTADGEFIVAATSYSNDGDVSGNHGQADYWIVKLDENGNLVWQKCLGGSNEEVAFSVQQPTDEGYIVAGWSRSSDGDVSVNYGEEDFWVVKLSSDAASDIVPLSNAYISVYPNPASDKIQLSFSSPGNKQFEIVNQSGMIVITENLYSEKIEMDIHNLPSGLYIIKAQTASQIARYRFIKQ